MKRSEIKRAKGMTGILHQSMGEFFFRIYEGRDFKDYKINHHDLEIKIVDWDAHIYPTKDENWDGIIDYSPQALALGRPIKEDEG